MKLREIVDDLELQRFDALKDNAKRAQQELQDALVRLKTAKAKQEMLKARSLVRIPVKTVRDSNLNPP